MLKSKITRFLSVLLALSLLAGMGITAFAADTALPDFSTGDPWRASTVQGAVTPETPTSLKDDYYLYKNKDAILSCVIAPGYSSAGLLGDRDVENDQDILALFTEPFEAESHDAKLAQTMYNLFMDWDTRNALGVQPLKDLVEFFEQVSSIEELNEYYSTVPYEQQVAIPFSFSPSTNFNNSAEYIINICSGPLLLGDSAEYSELTEYGAVLKEATDALTLYMLDRMGYSETEAQQMLDNCYALETALAPYIFSSDEQRDPDFINQINNVLTLEEMREAQGAVPILQVIDLCGFEAKNEVILNEPVWLEAFRTYYTDEYLEWLKDYAIIHLIVGCSSCLDRDAFQFTLECSNAVTGSTGYLSDEEYAAQSTLGMLGWPVSRLYCERYFTEQDKENVRTLIEKVIAAYSEMLLGEEFISEETRLKAIEKLDCMQINVLYPDSWDDYSYEELNLVPAAEGGTCFDAILEISRFEMNKLAKDFSEPVKKDKWDGLLPTVVNAFYSPTENSVNILAAFCRGGIYNSDMPIEEQYAKLAMVIGHEISHSFDGTGSQFDKDGNLSNWWTDEDRANFSAKLQAIADYADTIYCWEGTHINGSIITGEACADMGAMACMLHIAEGIEDFDYELFFTKFAELWCYLRTYNAFLSRLKNEHPPEFYRVNATLQQFEEFYDCYGITEDDGMYLAPEQRIAIW